MKKIFTIILLSALSLTTFAQQKIALLEPRAGEGSTTISGMEKAMLRGELRKAIVNQPGFEAFTRGDIDQLMKEQDFQRTGNVSEADIHKMGEMSGADYICVSTLNKSDNEFYLEAYLINVETGAISNPASQYGELINGKLANMLPVCEALAQELLGNTRRSTAQNTSTSRTNTTASTSTNTTSSTPTSAKSVSEDEYIDLGLPSGTLWKRENENGYISFEQAKNFYGNAIPSKEQWEELKNKCLWTWTGNGYNVTGPSKKTIFFPVGGYRDGYGTIMAKKNGLYWSSTPIDLDSLLSLPEYKYTAKQAEKFKQAIVELGGVSSCMKITSKSVQLGDFYCSQGLFVRLVK